MSSAFTSFLGRNHFFDVPRKWDIKIEKTQLTAGALEIDYSFKLFGEKEWYAGNNFRLNRTNPENLGHEIYPFTFFGVLESTPWYDRLL